jgi:histidinol-phosphate aminotransferase
MSSAEARKALSPASISRRSFLTVAAATLGALPVLGSGLVASRRAHAYPPDPAFENVARMVFHENPWGPHPAAVEAIRAVLGSGLSGGGINRFDDFLQYELKRALLRHNGLDDVLAPENVILGVGSAEVLFMAADTFTGSERPFLTEWITYRIILQRVGQNGADVVKVPLRSDWSADLDAMEEEILNARRDGRPYGLVHFNVINNPAGTFLHRDSFDTFARSVYQQSPETILLCDDSDKEFMDADQRPLLFQAAEHVREGRNVLHVQTFSHVFGLTGLRIGYGIARKDIIDRMEAHRIFAGVNVVGHAAAAASLEHADEQITRCHAACTASRNWLYKELDAMGLRYLPSQGHYILIDLDTVDGTAAVLRLYTEHKVFVRFGSEWDLKHWIRVNPGTEYENARFISGLRAVLGKGPRPVAWSAYRSTTAGARLARVAIESGFPRSMLQG